MGKASPRAMIFNDNPCTPVPCGVRFANPRCGSRLIRFFPEFTLRARLAPVAVLVLSGGVAACGAMPRVAIGPAIVPPATLVQQQVQGCGQDQVSHLVGQPFTELAKFRLRGHLRVLRPGQGITRDLMPDRLNVQVDGAGVILHLFCG